MSSLRSTTVEFEGAKHEIRHLQEEVEVLNSQVANILIIFVISHYPGKVLNSQVPNILIIILILMVMILLRLRS